MVGAMIKIKEEHKVIIFTLIAVALIWTADAAYDAFVAHEGDFIPLLTNVTLHEPFLRMFMTLGFLFFGIIISRILAKHNRVEALLRKQSAAIETSMDGIAIYNEAGEYVFVNQAYAEINGYAGPEEVMGKTYRQAYDDIEIARIDQVCLPSLRKNGRWRGELIAKRKNGSTYFQEASVTMLEDGGRVCIISDITWRKRSEERLRRSERFLNMILDSIRDPFCIFDNEFRVIRANEAYAALKNRSIDDLIGRKCHEVLENRDTVCDTCVVDKSFHSADPCAKEKQITLKDGAAAWLEIYTYPILDEDGKAGHVMEYTRDITERKKAEDEKRRLIERLEYLSSTDSLTGLMNRRALTDSLIYEIDRAKRYRSALSIILCDIDNFKEINDTWGHDVGDRVLQTISATLKTILRRADIVGRHGGDEFLLILPETSDKGAEGLADKLLAAVRTTDMRSRDGRLIGITLSIGVACLDPGLDDMDSFLKRADDAMYASKQGGRNRVSTAKL
jgi:diguanylate cyclase (GGDEF)-like protein/PAS domain S-box-containing protein